LDEAYGITDLSPAELIASDTVTGNGSGETADQLLGTFTVE
jgi:hypothetical protein